MFLLYTATLRALLGVLHVFTLTIALPFLWNWALDNLLTLAVRRFSRYWRS
jgi:hypothetical protein